METPNQPEPKKSNTGLMIGIGGVVVVALLCCCAVTVIAMLTIMGPAIGRTFSSINDAMTPSMPGFPTMPPDSDFPQTPSDMVPQGGRGDEVLRASAWGYVLISAAVDGCSFNAEASETTIEITQEPDSSGEWEERWTVVCDDGSEKPYQVTFTPSAGGGTDINVTNE